MVFTNKRLIAVNVRGITGSTRISRHFRTAAFKAFLVKSAGTFDLDADLDLWFSGLGKVRLELKGNTDIRQLGPMMASYVL